MGEFTEEFFLISQFLNYKERKENGTLYNESDITPQRLILYYYLNSLDVDFNHIVSNFKEKYVFNENELENVANKQERVGLGVVYDYIRDKQYESLPSIYVILKLHQLLYSKVPYPEFGGKFRKTEACISDSDVKTTPPNEIPIEINNLTAQYQSLLEQGEKIKDEKRPDLLIEYINNCLDLKCRLIEIHPFPDGNGRTSRALVNLLFRRAGLPIVYIQTREKEEYIKAMDAAIRLGDKTAIRKFYYYKICDSIIELDMDEKVEEFKNEMALSKKENNGPIKAKTFNSRKNVIA